MTDFIAINDPSMAAIVVPLNLAACPQYNEPHAGNPDPVNPNRPYIPSSIEPVLIAGLDRQFFPNNTFFRTHNFQNLVNLYFNKLDQNKRVVAYGFHGTSRWPQTVLTSGLSRLPGPTTGASTNIDVLNYYGGQQSGTLAGFFSTTRSVNVAKYFAHFNTTAPQPAFVYALLIEGAIMDPPNKVGMNNTNPATPLVSQYNEQEMASVDDVPRWKIVAYRQMNQKGAHHTEI